MPNGSEYWRMKCRHDGKEKRLAFGVYPAVTLREASPERDTARTLQWHQPGRYAVKPPLPASRGNGWTTSGTSGPPVSGG
jgi:hypothetical protein